MCQSCSLALGANSKALQSTSMKLNCLSLWILAQSTLLFESSPRGTHEPMKTVAGKMQSHIKQNANTYVAVCQEWVPALPL